MGFLPLAPSAHASAWTTEPDGGGREDLAELIFRRDDYRCRFCGHHAPGWQEIFHLDGDHANWSPDNLATACTLCHGAQHLGRPMVEQEFVLIWLPDMSQAALNMVVRHIQLILYAHDEPPDMSEPPRCEDPRPLDAVAAYSALAAEAQTLEARIHTASPRELGAALLNLADAPRDRLAGLLGGIRLLHKGRHFRAGRDVYPQILADWAALGSTS